MAIRVIGAGLGRTGTLSLKAALEEVGFGACYHMIELLGHPEQVHFWEAASRGEPVHWDALFAGYQSIVDYPGCRYYRTLMEHYPDAKVVLTVRDPDRWYESTRETIYKAGGVAPGVCWRGVAPIVGTGAPEKPFTRWGAGRQSTRKHKALPATSHRLLCLF